MLELEFHSNPLQYLPILFQNDIISKNTVDADFPKQTAIPTLQFYTHFARVTLLYNNKIAEGIVCLTKK